MMSADTVEAVQIRKHTILVATRKEEQVSIKKIISNLWYLSTITENIDYLIQECEELWSEEEQAFLLNIRDPYEKCTAFYSKFARSASNHPQSRAKLMAALRSSGNTVAANEISTDQPFVQEEEDNELDLKSSKEEATLEMAKSYSAEMMTTDDENLECIEFDITTTSDVSVMEGTSSPTPSLPIACTYKLSGVLSNPTSTKFVQFGPKIPMQKILQPQGIFISESFYQRITTLQINDFIISLPHLVLALQNCAVVETLELKNVFYELLPIQKGQIDPGVLSGKLWLPKLKNFKFEAKNIPNTLYSTEGYTWDMIFFIETNKGSPLTLRNIWQGKTLDISVNTLSLELYLNHQDSSIDFTLYRRHFNSWAIIPDYFLDSFLRNCRRLKNLRLVLPEICAKLDYDCLPQELAKLQLTGFVLLGSFSASRPVKEVTCVNCRFPEIFLSELQFLFPVAQSIKLLSCTKDGNENLNGPNINLEIVLNHQID